MMMTSRRRRSTPVVVQVQDGFLYVCFNGRSDLEALEINLQEDDGCVVELKESSINEMRISITDDSFCTGPGHEKRTRQFVSSLKTMLRKSQPDKIIFDSGLSMDSSLVPFEVIGTALQEATRSGASLKRIDLSFVRVVYNISREPDMELERWKESFLSSSSSSPWDGTGLPPPPPPPPPATTLTQCCLDRCSLVATIPPPREEEEDNDDDDNNSHQETIRTPVVLMSLSLDYLISLIFQCFPKLEWFTICPDAKESLTMDTITEICRAPSLKELALWNFDLRSHIHLEILFDLLALPNNSSKLQRLTLPTELSLSGAQAVAQYLRQPPATPGQQRLEGLTLTVNKLVGDPKQESLLVIAGALKVNQSLQSFRIRGSGIKVQSLQGFVEMLQHHNTTLQYFSILNVIDTEGNQDDHDRIQMFLTLNKHGRGRLLREGSTYGQWVETLVALRLELDCLFYLLQTNPSLCTNNNNATDSSSP